MEDDELIKLCQNGDKTAFEMLFRKYNKLVYGIAYRMTNNKEDALDLTQDIFLNVYQNIHKFKFKSTFSTWLYRISVNMCIDELRKWKKYNNVSDTEFPHQIQADERTPEDYAISKERERLVKEAISSLNEKDRAIIVLRDMEGLSYNEIADVLKCSLGRVKSRIHEARKKLKMFLEKKEKILSGVKEEVL